MKDEYILTFGIVGTTISSILEFIGIPISTLLATMILDFVSGLIVAIYFKNSPKTETGTLSSKIGYRGLCKKGLILIYIFIGLLLDSLLNLNYVANTICFGFIANEILSIIENTGLMGFKAPSMLINVIDILKKKEVKND